jgi:hypothetical protein
MPSQVGVYFLGRGTNRRLWAAQQPEALENDNNENKIHTTSQFILSNFKSS